MPANFPSVRFFSCRIYNFLTLSNTTFLDVPSITEAAFWMNTSLPIMKARYARLRTLKVEIKDVITSESEEFARIMAELRKKYPELLLENLKLSKVRLILPIYLIFRTLLLSWLELRNIRTR